MGSTVFLQACYTRIISLIQVASDTSAGFQHSDSVQDPSFRFESGPGRIDSGPWMNLPSESIPLRCGKP